jgi:hypothetical protein
VKLIDFGLVRRDDATPLTSSGAVVGSPGFMAPEQRAGGAVDARTDLYGLGCVLRAALGPGAPAALAELVAELCATEPARRPAGAAEVARRLVELRGVVDEAGAGSATTTMPSPLGRDAQAQACVLVVAAPDEPAAARALALAARRGVRLRVGGAGVLVAELGDDAGLAAAARRAAGAALAMRTWLDLAAAVTGGPLDGPATDPTAPLVARARARIAGAPAAAAGVAVDDATAELLAASFELAGEPGARQVVAERDDERPRLLLGRRTSCHGRERELRVITGLFQQCVDDPRAAAVLVTGVAGMGKTRLRHELERRFAAAGATVHAAAGDPLRAGAPLGLVAELLRRAAGVREDQAGAEQRARLAERVGAGLSGTDRDRVVAFLGEAAGIGFPDDATPGLAAARRDPRLMHEQLQRAWQDWLAAETHAGPVVLALDDLHAGDIPSLKLVDAALRALPDRPLLVLALGRPEVRAQLPDRWRAEDVERMELRPLPRWAAERLVREVLGDDAGAALVARLVGGAAGNPFFLEELIRAAAEGRRDAVPGSVLAVLQARVAALPEALGQALRAASIFGDACWEGGVSALLEAPAGPRLDALVAGEWLRSRRESSFGDERELAFDHGLVREAAYASLTAADRELGHRRAAAWLEAVGAADPLVVGAHWERGSEPARAIDCFRRAAARALAADDSAACIAHAERAVACGAAGETLGALRLLQAEASNWRGDAVGARERALEAVALLPEGGGPWAHAAHHATWSAGTVGDLASIEALAGRLAAAVGDRPIRDPLIAAAVCHAAQNAWLACVHGAARALIGLVEHGFAPELDGDHEVACVRAMTRATVLSSERPSEALAASSEAVEHARAAGNDRQLLMNLGNRGYFRVELGDYEGGLADFRACQPTGRHEVLVTHLESRQQNIGLALTRLGRLDEGLRELERALAYSRAAAAGDDGRAREAAYTRIYMAQNRLAAGQAEEALAHARAAATLSAALDGVRAFALAAEAEALLALGRVSDALATMGAARALLDRVGTLPEGTTYLLLVEAEALLAAGDEAAARPRVSALRARVEDYAARLDGADAATRYLTRVPEPARVMALARRLGV